MKIQTVHDHKIGATIKHDPTANVPLTIQALEAECREYFGPDAVTEINRASGAPGGLTSIAGMAFALGHAVGAGRPRFALRSAAPVVKAPIAPPPPKKTFRDHVSEMQARGMSKAAAVSATIKEFPELHAEWLRGDTSKL